MKIKKYTALLAAVFYLFFNAIGCTTSATPAEKPGSKGGTEYGQLQVLDGTLCDSEGNPVQLKGMSTMGLQWYGEIVNPDAFDALKYNWKVDVIRLAFYVGEGGYASDPSLKDILKKGIELAIERGIYVIVDWHVLNPGNPNDPVYSGVEDFFNEISLEYGEYENVIYEIMNEPNGRVNWAADLKPYAQKMVDLIRANDPDNLIVIGSGTWSQDINIAAADPVEGENLMYAVHFYSGTHGEQLREKVIAAMELGAAVFCTEWGTSESSGNGGPYINLSEEWLDFFNENNISWTNWSLCTKDETSAALDAQIQTYDAEEGIIVLQEEAPLAPEEVNSDGYKYWPQEQLSVSGAYVRAKIRGDGIPVYSQVETVWNFESGAMDDWQVPSDSELQVDLGTGTAEDNALVFSHSWKGQGSQGSWDYAVRLRMSDINYKVGDTNAIVFDLYLESGKEAAEKFEVNAVLQYPPSWWTQLKAVKFRYEDGELLDNGLLKYHIESSYDAAPTDEIKHIVILVIGSGTEYEGQVYVDNIALLNQTNGDVSEAPEKEQDDPGEFLGLPWDFEKGGRQGWVVGADTAAMVDLQIRKAETNALSYDYGWKNPGPEDPWFAAPRISSVWVNLKYPEYSIIDLDFYIKKTDVPGKLQIQPVVQIPETGYWFEIALQDVVFSEGEELDNGLLKYSLSFEIIDAEGKRPPDNSVLRNLIFVTLGIDTDYKGALYYDNINFR